MPTLAFVIRYLKSRFCSKAIEKWEKGFKSSSNRAQMECTCWAIRGNRNSCMSKGRQLQGPRSMCPCKNWCALQMALRRKLEQNAATQHWTHWSPAQSDCLEKRCMVEERETGQTASMMALSSSIKMWWNDHHSLNKIHHNQAVASGN